MDREHIKKCLVGYKQVEQTSKEIQRVITTYRGLAVRCAPFVFNDGRSQDLTCLEGTIPVSFKGIFYNIPISIHLMKTHPSHPPMCFVKPTTEMNIKTSVFVDGSGKIYLPYLHEWSPSKSNLMALIQVMMVTFGEHPPVFSKPKESTVPPPLLPYPHHPQGYMPMPGAGYAGSGYPQQQPTAYPHHQQQQPAAYPHHQQQQPAAYPHHQQPLPAVDTSSTPSGNNSGGGGTITEEHIRLSLVSAIEHKVKRRLEDQVSQQRAELDILTQTAHELCQGRATIQALIDKLNKEKTEVERKTNLLREKDAELERSISELRHEDDMDVDEAVTTTAPLYKQIVNSYAEEAATEDAIYYMGEALRRGVIDLDVFLKQVRFLSRKQFILRALVHKCRLKAGLAG